MTERKAKNPMDPIKQNSQSFSLMVVRNQQGNTISSFHMLLYFARLGRHLPDKLAVTVCNCVM